MDRDNKNLLYSQKKSINLFHQAAVRVSAYKKFLKKHKINPNLIQTYKDFINVPFTDKKNYIDLYPLHERVWDGDVSKSIMMNSSSGTTGIPYYWPTGMKHINEASFIHDYIYTTYFHVKEKKTLLIICFGLGTWVAGMYTILSTFLLHSKNYSLTIITPGFDKKETLRILSTVGSEYEQVVIAGIPTFVKDVLEEWKREHKKEKLIIKLLLAGEGFSESWRSYVLSLISQKERTSCISILGSAEGSVMGFETKLTINIRALVSKNSTQCLDIFQSERVPSLSQFDPTLRFFEQSKDELLITADRGAPLIRYNIHDVGGVKSFNEMKDSLGKPYNKLFEKQLQLPFVFVFGRGKFTATIYAANIYSENIREVLIHKKVSSIVTGRFILETVFEKNQSHSLHFHVELSNKIKPSERIRLLIKEIFVTEVSRINSEYKRILLEYKTKAYPVVELWEYKDPIKFPKKLKKTS